MANDDLFELDISDLMKIQVVSRSLEDSINSAGVVSAYRSEQLRSFGLTTIDEFLDFATNLSVDSDISSIKSYSIRGLSESNNQKVLFLVDGIPSWKPGTGDFAPNSIPLSAIEKIEIIRGSASVLYGTNSSAGVINIVTRKDFDTEAQFNHDSNGSTLASAYSGLNTEIGNFYGSLTIQSQPDQEFTLFNSLGPFDPSCFCTPVIPMVKGDRKENYTSVLGQYYFDDFKFTAQYFAESQDYYANSSLQSPSEFEESLLLIGTEYRLEEGDGYLRVYGDWQRFFAESPSIESLIFFTGLEGSGSVSYDNKGTNNTITRLGVEGRYSILPELSSQLGAELTLREMDDYKFRDDSRGALLISITQPPFNLPFEIQNDGTILLRDGDQVSENAVFGQLDYQMHNVQIGAGLRFTESEIFGSHTSPKISTIYSLTEKSSIKALFSEGFNSPTFRQYSGRNSLGIKLDVDVQPEITQTKELSYEAMSEHTRQAITLFEIEVKDLIFVSQQQISNLEESVFRNGIEYEFVYQKDPILVMGSYSYLLQGYEANSNDVGARFAAKHQGKLGFSYKISNHTTGFSIRYGSRRAEIDEFYYGNLNYSYRLNNFSASITVKNLLNDSGVNPNVRIYTNTAVQELGDRFLDIGVKFQF